MRRRQLLYGVTRRPLEERVSEHNRGALGGYTALRRPVQLVWSQEFQRVADAISAERRIKGWSRRKKLALIDGDWARLKQAAKKDFKRKGEGTPFDTPPAAATQGEAKGVEKTNNPLIPSSPEPVEGRIEGRYACCGYSG